MLSLGWIMAFGAIGVALRYGVDFWMAGRFPGYGFLGTLSVNIVGSFSIGACLAFIRNGSSNPDLYRMLSIGLLGGFTTFSAYALQTFQMFEESQYWLAGGYFVISPILAFMAAWLGLVFFRGVVF